MQRYILYGLGFNCRQALDLDSSLLESVLCFSDADPEKRRAGSFNGKPVVSPEELPSLLKSREQIVITTQKYESEIREALTKRYGIPDEALIGLPEWVRAVFSPTCSRILSRLPDQESRDFFYARLDYASTRLAEPFISLIKRYSTGRRYQSWHLGQRMKKSGLTRAVLFSGKDFLRVNLDILSLCRIPVAAACCPDTAGICPGSAEGGPERPAFLQDEEPGFESLTSPKYSDCIYIIPGYNGWQHQIADLLRARSIPEDRIWLLPGTPCCTGFRNGQYFDVWEPRKEEVFLDCGAYDGRTTREFIQWTGGHYGAVAAFEPLSGMESVFWSLNREARNVHFVPAAVWSETAELRFEETADRSASNIRGVIHHHPVREHVVPAVSLDEAVNGPVTLIKLDVEGSELAALKGAETILRTQRPRLAVSIYHGDMDFLNIPDYLLSIVPEYRFLIRHYGADLLETVLYASTDQADFRTL